MLIPNISVFPLEYFADGKKPGTTKSTADVKSLEQNMEMVSLDNKKTRADESSTDSETSKDANAQNNHMSVDGNGDSEERKTAVKMCKTGKQSYCFQGIYKVLKSLKKS